ncbi:myosin-9 [Dorcoceras hygrometricum]|uniref:Myosin-9 n=1 Tax=Dorcoceras hygrometricum TaxID=472368 RepID=A0A2Z7C4Z0_9LAMI|nr:myosin-9 [Dorcoceras hygrometricum]
MSHATVKSEMLIPNAGSSSSASLDFSRWCISTYPVVARDQLLRVTDLCCSDLVVAAVCGNYSSEAGELLHCIRMIIPISAVVAVLCCYSVFLPGCEDERQYFTLISLLLSPYWGLNLRSLWGCCVCLPVCCSGFPGYSAGRVFDPAGGAPGCDQFLRDVQLVSHSVSVAPSVQTSIASVFALDVQSITSSDSSADSSLHFNANDISTEDDAALAQSILPSSAIYISASLAALRESFSKLVANQSRDSRKSGDARSEVSCKINHVERVFLDSLTAQNEAFRDLFKSIRQEAQNDNNALTLALKAVRTQNAILSTDLAATQKKVKDLKTSCLFMEVRISNPTSPLLPNLEGINDKTLIIHQNVQPIQMGLILCPRLNS